MGMSTHVVAFKPADETWKAMKAVWDACLAARVQIPIGVLDFFGSSTPDETGVEVGEDALRECGAVRKWSTDDRAGFEVDVTKLPPDVKVVRFYNSW